MLEAVEKVRSPLLSGALMKLIYYQLFVIIYPF